MPRLREAQLENTGPAFGGRLARTMTSAIDSCIPAGGITASAAVTPVVGFRCSACWLVLADAACVWFVCGAVAVLLACADGLTSHACLGAPGTKKRDG